MVCLTSLSVLAQQPISGQAVSTITEEWFENNSTNNVSNALYGLLPGLTVIQQTGWNDNAALRIRGGASLSATSPLIVVDGIPRSLSYLNMLEIESVSVLKDGAATALWGTRGANGVVLITTKKGSYNSRKMNISYTFGMGLPINQPEFADGYTYALMRNEALYNDGLPMEYDAASLEAFRNGTNPDVFPNVDWQKEALRDFTTNHQLNLNFRGGGSKLRYFSAINYSNDQGILNNSVANYTSRYNAQMKKYKLDVRMNLDVDVTSTTKVALSMLVF
jgi:TonB-dependent outer membrane receptor, SusC/RagA subfamily, signature region